MCLAGLMTTPASHQDGTTALHLAAEAGHTAIVERLLLEGANSNSATQVGWMT